MGIVPLTDGLERVAAARGVSVSFSHGEATGGRRKRKGAQSARCVTRGVQRDPLSASPRRSCEPRVPEPVRPREAGPRDSDRVVPCSDDGEGLGLSTFPSFVGG